MSTEANNEGSEVSEDLEVSGEDAEEVTGGRMILMERSEIRKAVKQRHFRKI